LLRELDKATTAGQKTAEPEKVEAQEEMRFENALFINKFNFFFLIIQINNKKCFITLFF
jgi:hypothetical protein